jgi:peptidoglycan/LPS O-acetylase OafA/YrhL
VDPAKSIHYFYYVYLGQFFLAGIIAYMYRDVIRLSAPLAIACFCIVLAGAAFGGFFLTRVIAGSYLLLWLAYGAPKVPDIFTRHGDLSYGIYIYAFPVQQLVAESFDWGKTWQGNIALALPLTFLLAYFSWRFVEAPSLRARRNARDAGAFTNPNTGPVFSVRPLPLGPLVRKGGHGPGSAGATLRRPECAPTPFPGSRAGAGTAS